MASQLLTATGGEYDGGINGPMAGGDCQPGRGARLRRKLVANQPRNWLLALYFLACAKSTAGTALSDQKSSWFLAACASRRSAKP